MTPLKLVNRLLLTWAGVSVFAFTFFTLMADNHGSRLGRALVAGFFIALCSAPAYYLRLRKSRHSSAA